MSMFLRLLGGALIAFGFAACVNLADGTHASDVAGMASLWSLFLLVLPGALLYRWGLRMRDRRKEAREDIQEAVAAALREERERRQS